MKIEWKTCIKAAVTVFTLYLAITYWSDIAGFTALVFGAAAPLFIGGIIAYIVNLLMRAIEKRWFPASKKKFVIKSRRPVCMILAFIAVIAVMALVVGLVLPEFVNCIMVMVDYIPDAMDWVVESLQKIRFVPEKIVETLASVDWENQLGKIVDTVTNGFTDVMSVVISAVTSVLGGIVTTFLSIIFAVYLLLDKERLLSQGKRLLAKYLRPALNSRITYVIKTLDECFGKYIVGQCTEAVILGVLCTVGMWILGLPYATMIGALIALTALVPVAGAYIGGGIGAFMILMQSPVKAVIFVVFLVILQQLEGNLIYPKVVGSSLGLPAIWVLAAVTVGGGVMGISGMLIGVPVAAAVYRIIRNDVNGKTEEEIRKASEA